MTDYFHAPRTLIQDMEHWARKRSAEPWLVENWTSHQREVTWQQGHEEVSAAAAWLADSSPEPGRRIGLLAPNCAHWILADYAIMASGNVTVPIFTTMDADSVGYAADFAGVDLLFLGNAANWASVRDSFPAGMPVVCLPGAPEHEGAVTWDQIVSAGRELPAAPSADENALATIVFTSGTTGRPKGVMHSLATLRAAGGGVGHMAGSQPGHRFLSYLPLAHLGERVVVENHAMVYGGTIFFNESQESFLNDLRQARPSWLLGVPRIWEKLQQVVLAHLVSLEELEAAKASGDVEAVSQKVKSFLGLEDTEYILTSTAPTPAPLKAWYADLGIVLYDGYGQSEILPVCGNQPDDRKIDSIGVAAEGVEIKIAEDGEILARGGGTALGYYQDPEKTAETFEPDGWVHTGDRGRIDEDGHVYITGRVKEIFKTAKGKYVAPAPIEGRFLDTPLAEQACLTGHGLAQTVLVVVVSESAASLSDEEITSQLMDWVQSVNERLEKHERIGALVVSRTPWSQENGVLTHTLKIKRDTVEERYEKQLEEAGDRMRHGEPLFAIWVN
jgi:long-chain acyl-CoA synthetase